MSKDSNSDDSSFTNEDNDEFQCATSKGGHKKRLLHILLVVIMS